MINNQQTITFFSSPILNCAIKQLLKKKKKKKAEEDSISNEMISHLGSVAKQKLLDTYNQPWNTGTFPTSWKEAIIIPIHKKGKDRHSKTSYHPISLLRCLGNTMERMVNRILQHHLEKNGLLSLSHSLASGRTEAHRTKWHCLPRISRMAFSKRWRHWLSLSTSSRLSTKYGRRVFSSSS